MIQFKLAYPVLKALAYNMTRGGQTLKLDGVQVDTINGYIGATVAGRVLIIRQPSVNLHGIEPFRIPAETVNAILTACKPTQSELRQGVWVDVYYQEIQGRAWDNSKEPYGVGRVVCMGRSFDFTADTTLASSVTSAIERAKYATDYPRQHRELDKMPSYTVKELRQIELTAKCFTNDGYMIVKDNTRRTGATDTPYYRVLIGGCDPLQVVYLVTEPYSEQKFDTPAKFVENSTSILQNYFK